MKNIRRCWNSVEEVYYLLQRPEYQAHRLDDLDLLTQGPGQIDGQIGLEQRRALEDYWKNARGQASFTAQSSSYGSMPASMKRALGSLKVAQLNWRQYLWRYLVQTPVDFSGFDRRFNGRQLYLDALTGESVQVVIAVDTSGSIDDEQVRLFLGEVKGILTAVMR